MRMRFRETLWFKFGATRGDEVEGAVDDDTASNTMRPIEDRYLDAGGVDPADSRAFGLRTGTTQALRMLPQIEPTGVSERVLARELKRTGRLMMLAAIALAVLASAGAALAAI